MAEYPTRTIADYSSLIHYLRADLAREFPSLAQGVFIVDQSQDPEAQLAEAAKQFGVPDLRARMQQQTHDSDFPALNRQPVHIHLAGPPARDVHLIYGAGYENDAHRMDPSAPLSNTMYGWYALSTLHEVGHVLQASVPLAPSFEHPRIFSETFADLYALDTMQRAGIMPPHAGDTFVGLPRCAPGCRWTG